MKLAHTLLASSLLSIVGSMALAQQAPLTGTLTMVDRINGTVTIQPTQSGTVGASGGAAAEQYKAQPGMLTTLHAGDRVTFSVSESGGTKTLTKIEK